MAAWGGELALLHLSVGVLVTLFAVLLLTSFNL
jgi:hypothetical protein